MTIETPNRVHAAAVLLIDNQGQSMTAQVLNSANLRQSSLTFIDSENMFMELVQPIPSVDVVATRRTALDSSDTDCWVTPTLSPTGDASLDDLPDNLLVFGNEITGALGYVSVAVFGIPGESLPGPIAVSV